MTWRVCSPPWPGLRNPGSWPGRRQCGLPSAGPPLRSASHPLPGGQCGTGGPGGLGRPAPESGWPRRWSWQRPGWAASWRPTGTCCPAPFSSWPTLPWRRLPRITPVRSHPQTRPERGTPRLAPCSRTAGRSPDRATRGAPVSSPAGRTPRGRTFHRTFRRRPVTVPPGRPAGPSPCTRRVRRRGHRPIRAHRQSGSRCRRARASSRCPRASPPYTRMLPDRPVSLGS